MYAHSPPLSAAAAGCGASLEGHKPGTAGCVHGGQAEPLAAVPAVSFGAPLAAACSAELAQNSKALSLPSRACRVRREHWKGMNQAQLGMVRDGQAAQVAAKAQAAQGAAAREAEREQADRLVGAALAHERGQVRQGAQGEARRGLRRAACPEAV